jgi:fumarate reductase subunit C
VAPVLSASATPASADRWPARLDLVQAVSGLVLVVFMIIHMFLVSSILLGKDAMYVVTRILEGEYLFGRPYPLLVSLVAAVVLAIFLLHALVAMWKMPASYRQYRVFWRHSRAISHTDTRLWLLQVVTGLVLMFTATVHLYEMLMNPADIGPYASADRVVSGGMWALDLVLIFAVEVHGGIGLYRLIIKWDWFASTASAQRRRRIRALITGIVGFLVLLGLLTFAAYLKIGIEHRGQAGERYLPSWQQGVTH